MVLPGVHTGLNFRGGRCCIVCVGVGGGQGRGLAIKAGVKCRGSLRTLPFMSKDFPPSLLPPHPIRFLSDPRLVQLTGPSEVWGPLVPAASGGTRGEPSMIPPVPVPPGRDLLGLPLWGKESIHCGGLPCAPVSPTERPPFRHAGWRCPRFCGQPHMMFPATLGAAQPVGHS